MRSAFVTVPFMLVGLGLATSAHATGPAPQRPACIGCGPDIEVHTLPDAVDMASGASHDFGSTPVGTPVEYEFGVGATQFLPALAISTFTVPAGFSVDQAPPDTIEGGASYLVRVMCDATTAGSYSGDISIVSDDVDESPFTIAVTCEVTAVEEDDTSDTTAPTDDAGSGAGIPTTGSSSTTLLALAGGLLAVGASVRVAARRRA